MGSEYEQDTCWKFIGGFDSISDRDEEESVVVIYTNTFGESKKYMDGDQEFMDNISIHGMNTNQKYIYPRNLEAPTSEKRYEFWDHLLSHVRDIVFDTVLHKKGDKNRLWRKYVGYN